jgi:(p)ppGpp synthase/HD superfamily hydrolase
MTRSKKMKRLSKAIRFATECHNGQYRKFTKIPYITHPVGVMTMLSRWGVDDEEVLIAAVFHDLVEDTDVLFETINRNYGRRVEDIVVLVTKTEWDSSETYLDRLLNSDNLDAMILKIADRLYNYDDLVLEGRVTKSIPYFLKISEIVKRVLFSEEVDIQIKTNIKSELDKRSLKVGGWWV